MVPIGSAVGNTAADCSYSPSFSSTSAIFSASMNGSMSPPRTLVNSCNVRLMR